MSIVIESITDIKKIGIIESEVVTKADQAAVDTALGLKADKSTTYTKL